MRLSEKYPRPLDAAERAVLTFFAELVPEASRRAFLAQIERAWIVREDASHTSFSIKDAPAIDASAFDHTLDAYYDDEDGTKTALTLHFADGFLSWSERYHFPNNPTQLATTVVRTVPDPALLRRNL